MPDTPKPAAVNGRPREGCIADGDYSPPNRSLRSFPQDRADVITTAVVQIIFQVPTPRDLHTQIAALLRDEIADIAAQVLAETRLSDP